MAALQAIAGLAVGDCRRFSAFLDAK